MINRIKRWCSPPQREGEVVSKRSVTRRAVVERKRCSLDSLERTYNEHKVVNTRSQKKGVGISFVRTFRDGVPMNDRVFFRVKGGK